MSAPDRLAEIKERLAVYDCKLQRTDGLKTTDAVIARADALWNILHSAPTDLSWLIAEVERLRERVDTFMSYGCPVCSGDCGAANPPVYGCPMVDRP